MSFDLRAIDGKQPPVGEKTPIECFRCGVCCVAYQAPVEDAEIRRLARATRMSVPAFKAAYLQDTPMGYLIRHAKEGCVFLEIDGASGLAACRVHGSRPDACRNWQASLDKPECRKGLAGTRSSGALVMPDQLYRSPGAADEFSRRLRGD